MDDLVDCLVPNYPDPGHNHDPWTHRMAAPGNHLPFHNQTEEEGVRMMMGEAVHSFSKLDNSKHQRNDTRWVASLLYHSISVLWRRQKGCLRSLLAIDICWICVVDLQTFSLLNKAEVVWIYRLIFKVLMLIWRHEWNGWATAAPRNWRSSVLFEFRRLTKCKEYGWLWTKVEDERREPAAAVSSRKRSEGRRRALRTW